MINSIKLIFFYKIQQMWNLIDAIPSGFKEYLYLLENH